MTDYTVGETVGFGRFTRYGGISSSGFGVVEKVNGFGHVFVKTKTGTKKFDKYGDSYKDKYGPRLIGAAKLTQVLEEIENENNIAATARELLKTVEDQRCGNGRYVITDDTLDEVEKLVAKLRDMV